MGVLTSAVLFDPQVRFVPGTRLFLGGWREEPPQVRPCSQLVAASSSHSLTRPLQKKILPPRLSSQNRALKLCLWMSGCLYVEYRILLIGTVKASGSPALSTLLMGARGRLLMYALQDLGWWATRGVDAKVVFTGEVSS